MEKKDHRNNVNNLFRYFSFYRLLCPFAAAFVNVCVDTSYSSHLTMLKLCVHFSSFLYMRRNERRQRNVL